MIKLTNSDIITILRAFHIADDTHHPRDIEQRAEHQLQTAQMRLIKFRFYKQLYYILVGSTQGNDTPSYLLQQVHTIVPHVVGKVVQYSSFDRTSYAFSFKGKYVYLVQAVPQKRRLDLKLAREYPHLSRSTWQKHIKAGYVAVNGTVIPSIKHEISEADHLAVALPTTSDFTDQTLPIVYLDEDVIVINKPAGVLTHSKGTTNDEFTVADFFRRYTTDGLATNRPGIVHRLDRDTSGILIGARSAQAAAFLKKQFARHQTKKTYIAVLDGLLPHSAAAIELPILRNPAQPSTFKVDSRGKPAVTHYNVLATNSYQTLVMLQPITGRTHQLRVHMHYLHTPIVGDRVYGQTADRLYLHAQQLEITLPDGTRRVFSAPIPRRFTTMFPGVAV